MEYKSLIYSRSNSVVYNSDRNLGSRSDRMTFGRPQSPSSSRSSIAIAYSRAFYIVLPGARVTRLLNLQVTDMTLSKPSTDSGSASTKLIIMV